MRSAHGQPVGGAAVVPVQTGAGHTGQAAPGRQQPDAAGVRPEPDRGGHEWREVQSVRGKAGECVQDGGNGGGVHRLGEGVLLDGAGVEFVVADAACAGAFLD